MKKLFLLLVVVAGAFALSSCAKGYTCTRTSSENGVVTNTSTYTYEALTSEEKTDEVNKNTYSYTAGGVLYEVKTECK
jgi:hypothetical protein